MIERFFLSITADHTTLSRITKFFREIGREELLHEEVILPDRPRLCWLRIAKDDPDLILIKKMFGENGWEFSESIERVYDYEELLQCKLLAFVVDAQPVGLGGPYYGTTYNLNNACKRCGSGAIQTSNLKLNPADIPRGYNFHVTSHNNILVSGRIASELKKRLRGFELRPAVSHLDGSELDYYQIIPLFCVPSISQSEGIESNACETCGRSGFHRSVERPVVLHYENLDDSFLRKADIFWTWELFGQGFLREEFSDSQFAQPLLLVKPAVMDIFKELTVKDAYFEPVVINGVPDTRSWIRTTNSTTIQS